MSIGVKVGSVITEIGNSIFLYAFFSTITGLLENNVRGSRYPVLSRFYQGHLKVEDLEKALSELKVIYNELEKFPPSAVIWNLEDRSKQPPWGNNIASTITSMKNYFVTSTGRDLFDVLFEIFSYALNSKKSLAIVNF